MSGKVSSSVQLVKMIVPAGKASPSPPVGPALGQKGVKAMDFCKLFNDRTKAFIPQIPIGVNVYIKPDKTFEFKIKGPATSYLLKKAAKIERGVLLKKNGEITANISKKSSGGTKFVPEVQPELSVKYIYEIARLKQASSDYLALQSIEQVAKMVKGSCGRLGIKLVE